MDDNGDEGSNLSLFNNTVVNGGSEFSGGSGQYIEAKARGSCFFDDSKFTVKIEDNRNEAIIGHVAFDDNSENWNYTNDNEDVIDVYVNNSGEQAISTITVEAP